MKKTICRIAHSHARRPIHRALFRKRPGRKWISRPLIVGDEVTSLKYLSVSNAISQRLLTSSPTTNKICDWHRATEAALKNILAGRAAKNLPPLDLSGGTEFQQAVWRELRKISLGKTKSYGEIAQAIGKARAVRAVGGACGANPIPVLVPCHRVLAAHGKIGGFGGGLDWKRRLLAREGVSL